jgi:hypothetical protein
MDWNYSIRMRLSDEPAVKLRTVLQNVPDPRGKQGQEYFLWSILWLIVVSLLCGRRGMLAAFCAGLQSILGNEASRGKGMEIPDALKLLG